MAIWIKTPPDVEPVWMAADNRIREQAEPTWKSELQDAFLRGSRL